MEIPSLDDINEKCWGSSGLVKILASCAKVGMGSSWNNFARSFSRTTWQSISICLVLSWNESFAII